jgi:hypothetical protein
MSHLRAMKSSQSDHYGLGAYSDRSGGVDRPGTSDRSGGVERTDTSSTPHPRKDLDVSISSNYSCD